MNRIHAWCVCVVAGATLSVSADNNIRRKFIGHGWDTMKATPAVVRANAAKFAKAGFDGITLALPPCRQADGSYLEPMIHLPTDPAWHYETYADQVPIMREIVSKPGLRDCFLACSFTPMRGRIAWTNDAGWARFAGNLRVFARLAHDGGLRGLFLDNEDYCARHQFALEKGEGDFDTVYRLARQRGREVFGGVFREFPEAVILPFWLLTQNMSLINSVDPVKAARNAGALWPAFVNGMFDVLPPTGRIVDGCENAYLYEWNKRDFATSAADQLVGFLPLIEPENRVKYRSQICVGFGLYLDMYVNEKGKTWYFGPVNGSRLEHLRLNFTEAAKRADEYIWVYGEKFSFVKWDGLDEKDIHFDVNVTWEDKLPGLSRVLRDVTNPGAGLMDRVHAARAKGVNLFPAAIKRESHWQNPDYKPAGSYAVDPKAGVGGTITITGVGNGCANLPIDAKPGETYVFDMWMAGSCGEGQRPTMCFTDADKKFHWELGTIHSSLVEKDSVGRSRFCAIARVPEKMAGINLMLNAGQRNGETGSFTDIFIAKSEE